MQHTKIEWVRNSDGSPGYTWNPITGCLQGCRYCYAATIAKRYSKGDASAVGHDLYYGHAGSTFPKGFLPTLYPLRLGEPGGERTTSTIFTGSMADMWWQWVPAEWTRQVLRAVSNAPEHRYLFLTKNPQGYCRYADEMPRGSVWLGVTDEGRGACRILPEFGRNVVVPGHKTFVSYEPLLGPDIDNWLICVVDLIIIGALTKNGRPVRPENGGTQLEWVTPIIALAEICGTPVFLKDNLLKLYPELERRRELPWMNENAGIVITPE